MAARIGQKLLTDKCSLQKKNDNLEEQLLQANDKVVVAEVVDVVSFTISSHLRESELPLKMCTGSNLSLFISKFYLSLDLKQLLI